MSDLMLDVDQAGELKAAFRRGDWTNAEIKKLCEGNILARVRDVVSNTAEIVPKKHLINCDAHPFIPDGWSVHEEDQLPRRVRGILEWDPKKVTLFLSEEQRRGSVKGDKLRELLAGKPVLPANVLDYLLAHPYLIPEEWKGRWVFFWGTIYRGLCGSFCVRCLVWCDGGWSWFCRWLDDAWDGCGPAALGASLPAEALAKAGI